MDVNFRVIETYFDTHYTNCEIIPIRTRLQSGYCTVTKYEMIIKYGDRSKIIICYQNNLKQKITTGWYSEEQCLEHICDALEIDYIE